MEADDDAYINEDRTGVAFKAEDGVTYTITFINRVVKTDIAATVEVNKTWYEGTVEITDIDLLAALNANLTWNNNHGPGTYDNLPAGMTFVSSETFNAYTFDYKVGNNYYRLTIAFDSVSVTNVNPDDGIVIIDTGDTHGISFTTAAGVVDTVTHTVTYVNRITDREFIPGPNQPKGIKITTRGN